MLIMPNLSLVKFLLNLKHQIFAEISSGIMLFLRCKSHFEISNVANLATFYFMIVGLEI